MWQVTIDPAAWITAAATAGLFFVGGVAIVYNRKLVTGTRQLADKTAELAASTRQQADATTAQAQAAVREAEASTRMLEEVRLDRELAGRPLLEYSHVLSADFVPRASVHFSVRNIGRGPAVGIVYCGYASWHPELVGEGLPTRRYFLASGPSIGPGGTEQYKAESVNYTTVWDILRDLIPENFVGVVDAVMCMDVFGNKYRFLRNRYTPEYSARDDPNAPQWTQAWSVLPRG